MNSRILSEQELINDADYRTVIDTYAAMSEHAERERGHWTTEYHIAMLKLAIKLAGPCYSCLRPPGAAGAILVTVYGHKILGCAEPPVGLTCKEFEECELENGHCVRTIHAEVSAILVAAKQGIILRNSTIYSILKPCYQCSKVIIAAGVSRIYYAGSAYDESRTRSLLKLASVEALHIDAGLEYGNV